MIEKKLDSLTSWQNLKSAARLPFVGSMYIWIFIVPIAAKALESIPETGAFTIFGQDIRLNLSLPFSWVVFYFSALAFAVANVLFKVRCPSIIQENDSFSDFAASRKGITHLDKYLFEAGMNWEGLRQALERADEHFHGNMQIEVYEGKSEPLQREFWMVMRYADQCSSRTRYLAALSYLFAFALIGVVIVQNLALVFKLGVLP
ncbi:hypothetical protein HPA02_05200 [Bisbaumannia pacifica]|uniref:Uncharacterized protein n=1 Tax=Bisbaumannia pacifica TaxID=77098 RepID=A0A510X651_9GAMM|nr:hypothetical protein [Halomonas pacifica]GEK46237.1 hypothetical protein HPA02_05200 [Halomonas pacifica]